MRPGDTECSVLDGSVAVATRSYEQQQRVQDLEHRRDIVNGGLLLTYGTAGTLASWFATRPRTPQD
ncbi:hypothetical protein ACFV5N_02255 [Streptomyces sp. NPDC059853]|uniref:hypothetical protein n=1 Tax=Streptomyces sp. NPDC059853 TaxID=3346973 RepID=UPI003646C157